MSLDSEILVATARAMSGEKELTLREGANHAESPLLKSDVLLLLSSEERAAQRGEIDRAALARRWHNANLNHGWQKPELYEAMEIARLDMLAAERYDGVRANLQAWDEQRLNHEPLSDEQHHAEVMGAYLRLSLIHI